MTIPPHAQQVADYLGRALILTGEQLAIVLGPSLLLALLMHYVSETIRARAGELIGIKAHVWLTAPGTVIHELGHALFCLVFGHQIKEISLFNPRSDGVLGYVRHSWNRRSLYQNGGNFFIGTGPIWLGTLLIFALAFALIGPPLYEPLRSIRLDPATIVTFKGVATFGGDLWRALLDLLQLLLHDGFYRDWRFWLFVYLLFCIGSHVTLSASDLSGALTGLGIIVLLALIFNLATLWLGDFALRACIAVAQFAVIGNTLLLFALILNALIAALLFCATLAKG